MSTPVSSTSGGLPIDSLIGTNQPASTASTGTQLGENAFLQLLTTELANQDPLQPMDDTQSVTQLAQFSALQSQTNLANSFQTFQSNFGVLQASSLIGKNVTVSTPDGSGNTSTQTGTVSTIDVQNGQPYFTMKDLTGNTISDNSGQPLLFSTTEIVGIG
ncbi:MAG: flagellar hook capping FlgD N-terminal domain-containing protein [Vulcanimicrobiaceae bacterium]